MADQDATHVPSPIGSPKDREEPDNPPLPLTLRETIHAEAQKLTTTDLTFTNIFNFYLSIVDQTTKSANHDPKDAVTFLTNALQDVMVQATGKEIPASAFRVTFEKPRHTGSSADGMGRFVCSIPSPLSALVVQLTPPKLLQSDGGRLEFTGDGKGNVYKLIFGEVVAPETFKEGREKGSDDRWLHLIPRRRTGFGEKAIYEKLVPHLANFGVRVMKGDNTFHIMTEHGGEQSQGKYHCDFDVDYNSVPKLAIGHYNLHGIEKLLLDEDTRETADIWMTPETAKKYFNVCNVCYKPLGTLCDGCDPTADKKKNAQKRAEKEKARFHFHERKKAKATTSFGWNP